MKSKFRVPAKEIEDRTKRIQKELQKNDMDGLFIVQRVDLFYFSGTAQNGYLYIPAQGKPLLLVKKYFPRAMEESSIPQIVEIRSVKEVPGRIEDVYGGLPKRVGFEFDVIPVKEFNFYEQLFKAQQCVDGSQLIHNVRMIKSHWEIAQMEKSAKLSKDTFEYILQNIQPGYTEIEFAGMFELFARKGGHGAELRVRDYQTEGYNWHILSGKSGGMVGLLDSPASGEGTSVAFPVGAGQKKLAPNEPIMIDLGIAINGFHVDETRMFAIESMPKKALDASYAAIEIHNEVLSHVKPGITLKKLFHVSVAKAKSLGYAVQYLGPPGYKVTFIGHGVCLELVEQPIISENNKNPLQSGMVFALEPKMVFKDEFTVGVESVFQVTETGHRLISKVPLEVFIC
jgi:Xaa-Pro dipeptidase